MSVYRAACGRTTGVCVVKTGTAAPRRTLIVFVLRHSVSHSARRSGAHGLVSASPLPRLLQPSACNRRPDMRDGKSRNAVDRILHTTVVLMTNEWKCRTTVYTIFVSNQLYSTVGLATSVVMDIPGCNLKKRRIYLSRGASFGYNVPLLPIPTVATPVTLISSGHFTLVLLHPSKLLEGC